MALISYFTPQLTVLSNYLCALATTLRLLITWCKLHVMNYIIIFIEKFSPLLGFEPGTSWYYADMLPTELSWLGCNSKNWEKNLKWPLVIFLPLSHWWQICNINKNLIILGNWYCSGWSFSACAKKDPFHSSYFPVKLFSYNFLSIKLFLCSKKASLVPI